MVNTFALLVPCFNCATYIESFIENIEKQTKPFDEIIFYDDASSDHTTTIIKNAGYRVIIGNTNQGPSHSRNVLLKNTTCTWVHFHDPDDYLHPDYLLKTSSIASTGLHDVVLCNVDWLYKDQLQKSYNYDHKQLNANPPCYTLENPIGGINGLYSKKKLLEIDGFDESLRTWEDADLHVRLATEKAIFFVIEETLSFSIRREHSASTNQKAAWLNRLKSLQKYPDLSSDPNFIRLVGLEAERAASYLIMYKSLSEAKEAMMLSIQCGNNIPSSNNLPWSVLKKIFHHKILITLRILQLRLAFKHTQ